MYFIQYSESDKCKEIFYFVLFVKFKEQMHFERTPLKAYIFYANGFLYIFVGNKRLLFSV